MLMCPNCNKIVDIDEHAPYCEFCGFVFIEFIERMDSKKVEEKTTTRRTGEGVDQIDG